MSHWAHRDDGRPAVLFYLHALAGGGAERTVATLASGFARSGWRVVLAVDREDGANRDFLASGIAVEVLGDGHARATWRLAQLLRDERPDISLSAMAAANLKHVAAAVLAGRRRHAVLSFHAYACSEPKRLSQLGYLLLPFMSRLAARTIAVSHALRHDLVARWMSDRRRTVTIHNPVLTGATRPTPVRPRPGPALVLAAGRLVPDKDMRAIVRAFAAVVPAFDARLVILGEGPERGAIETDVRRFGLTGRVELRGYVADPWPVYREASCFVTASRIESFSMVVAEALAFGLPVVAVDSPGPREVLADGRYGRLVPSGNDRALAEAMCVALREGSDPAPLIERAAAFSVEAGLKAYARLFTAVRAEAGSPAHRPMAADPMRSERS